MSNNQQTYWRSLNELANNEEYRKFVDREFPENADELKDGYSRRNFLQVMGASIALAGFAACRKPFTKIVPFTTMPEYMVAGKQVYYATSIPQNGYVSGLLVETNAGRPTKIEGNELHPSSNGKTNIQQQASILNLYDPDRSRGIRHNGDSSDWSSFISAASAELTSDKNIVVITENHASITVERQKQEFLRRFPSARWVSYEAYGEENQLLGSQLAFGRKLRVSPDLSKARVIVSLDADFMGPQADNVRNIQGYTAGRSITSTSDDINRLYIVESQYSLTGSNADHRLRLKSGDIKPFLFALAASLSGSYRELSAFAGYSNAFSQHEWIAVLTEELRSNAGQSIVMAGTEHDAQTHAAVAALNTALGNAGSTVNYIELPTADAQNQHDLFSAVVRDMHAGEVDAVVMLGTNPVFTTPADLDFKGALSKVAFSVHLANHFDETSSLVTWHVNRAHFLEYWGDGYDYHGVRSVIQPMILPLFDGKSEIEVLGAILSGAAINAAEEVKNTWRTLISGDFETRWQELLHDGIQPGSSFNVVNPGISAGFATAINASFSDVSVSEANTIEVVLRQDPKILDGRHANNGWLQELPDPISKITWDNVAYLSPTTARELGIGTRKFGQTAVDVVRVEVGGRSLELAAWVIPGHADKSVTIFTGYGRSVGRVGAGTGVNAFLLASSAEGFKFADAKVSVTGKSYEIATTQDHHSMEGRPLVREASLSEYREDPRFAADMVYVPGRKPGQEHAISLFNSQTAVEGQPQWGMAIDLSTCIGCGVCTIACQSENNIPVIGKDQVRRGREMHWIRTDRYFSGDVDGNPQIVHQPIPCQHCELAPCEQVCPVAATTHSDDGLNQMTYNRCIGTRYCANNCPFKVRRFNFFNYPIEFLTQGDDPEVIQMAMNPDVSIRFRGVIEKCSFCVQRISRAKIETKIATGNSRKPADGTVKTACQQACPANAISFGDLTDNNSKVAVTKRNERNYLLLEELNIRPRTSYLAKIRNPHANLA
jgi:MoCo/4Fe-4S cofactor protein with predicted Tat translocation signal